MAPIRWQPDRSLRKPPWPVPTVAVALGRGVRGCCPACGQAGLFAGFLRVVRACPHCHAPLGRARADDAPPYFVILLTGHVVIPPLVLTQRFADPSVLALTLIFVPLTLAVAVGLLRPVKGCVLAVIVALGLLDADPDAG